MPVGNEAAPELMPTPEQRKYMIDRIRYLRSEACDIPFYPMDFQNDGEFVGGWALQLVRQLTGVPIT